MNVLVIGSGGREHALCWRMHREGHQVFAIPGSEGIRAVATCIDGDVGDPVWVGAQAKQHEVDLVVIGPEGPLVSGLSDDLRAIGVAVFGPSAAGAKLEGSKAFSKRFFTKYQIPTAAFFACQTLAEVDAALNNLPGLVVVKVDGLAAGKGVVVCDSTAQARQVAEEMLSGRFGHAGQTIVIEERLIGREVSMMALCDGEKCELLASAEDHKAIFAGDRGPNTGGMGAVSPASSMTPELLHRIEEDIFKPTVGGLRAEGIDFRGVLYAGLMIDASGSPQLLEYNVRFGDPETQVVLPRIEGNLGEQLLAAARGALPGEPLQWSRDTAICVVLASAGYPQSSSTGDVIVGWELTEETLLFHAGTTRRADGALVTAGGRVLGVTALGAGVDKARAKAYDTVANLHFNGMQFRRDIGLRGET